MALTVVNVVTIALIILASNAMVASAARYARPLSGDRAYPWRIRQGYVQSSEFTSGQQEFDRAVRLARHVPGRQIGQHRCPTQVTDWSGLGRSA
ncbi:MAG TPA: hypothetical protein VEI74_03095 [Candidatus Methylomirabilis sp.]|nr:hypothetical protein [Candidatus Methylomirabilis sp.]